MRPRVDKLLHLEDKLFLLFGEIVKRMMVHWFDDDKKDLQYLNVLFVRTVGQSSNIPFCSNLSSIAVFSVPLDEDLQVHGYQKYTHIIQTPIYTHAHTNQHTLNPHTQ